MVHMRVSHVGLSDQRLGSHHMVTVHVANDKWFMWMDLRTRTVHEGVVRCLTKHNARGFPRLMHLSSVVGERFWRSFLTALGDRDLEAEAAEFIRAEEDVKAEIKRRAENDERLLVAARQMVVALMAARDDVRDVEVRNQIDAALTAAADAEFRRE